MVSRDLCPQLSSPEDTSRPSSLEILSASLQRQEEYWLVLTPLWWNITYYYIHFFTFLLIYPLAAAITQNQKAKEHRVTFRQQQQSR